jgi:mevalonate kinase
MVSLCGCFLNFFLDLFNISINDNDFKYLVNQNSFELEKIYHGNPSGIDNYTSTYGSLLAFNKFKKEDI